MPEQLRGPGGPARALHKPRLWQARVDWAPQAAPGPQRLQPKTSAMLESDGPLLCCFTKALSQLHESSCPASRKPLASFTKALAQLHESSCPASRKLLASFTKALSQLHESSCPASRKLLPSFAKALSQLHGRRQAESSLRLMSSSGQQRCLLLATAASAQRSCTLRPVPSMGGLTAPGARGCRPARGGLCTQTGPAAGRHRALWVWQYHQGPA